MRSAHAAAAASRDRLDHNGIANLFRDLDGVLLCFDDSVAARHYWHSCSAGAAAGRILITHGVHRADRRADEFDVAALTDFGEVRVLREKSVARMNGIDVADFRRAQDSIDLKITLAAGGSTDADRFIGQLHMQGVNICFRINRQRANAEFFARANHAQRDLAAIGDQNFFEHEWELLVRS